MTKLVARKRLLVIPALSAGLLGIVTIAGLATVAAADSPVTFSGDETFITFSEFLDITSTTPVTNQYESEGVVFSGTFVVEVGTPDYGVSWPGSGKPVAQNFPPGFPDVTATFSSPVVRAGMDVISELSSGSVELRAYVGGVDGDLVGVADFNTQRNPSTFVAIEILGGFDTLVIDDHGAGRGLFIVDDFRFEAEASSENHYLVYDIKAPPRDPVVVELADQFGAGEFVVEKLKHLANPTLKLHDGERSDTGRPELHYLSYSIEESRRTALISNQFGDLVVIVKKPKLLLVPAAKSAGLGEPETELPVPTDANHYKCYEIELPHGVKFPRGVRVQLDDQFGDMPRTFEVKQPRLLCNPVEKTHDSVAHLIVDADLHLVCYRVEPVEEEHRHDRRTFHTNDQFGPQLELITKKERDLCVPSEKTSLPWEPDGGAEHRDLDEDDRGGDHDDDD